MSKTRPTLAILTPAFPTEDQDTWLPAQAVFVAALNEHFPGLEIIILVFHFPEVIHKYHEWRGNKVVSFNGGMRGNLHTLWRWRCVWRELGHIRSSGNLIGIFSFFCSESAFIGHYFARRHRLAHFIWVLGQDARKDNRQVRRIKPQPGELIAISDFLVREFRDSHGIIPAHMIPIGVDPSAAIAFDEPRTIDILGAGTLSPIKGYDLFVDVVSKITESLPRLKAVICGTGSEEGALQQQIDRLELGDRIQLAGGKTHPQMLQTMQRSKILLHTSSYEGFGMVCVEALCAGAHVISFIKPLDTEIDHWHTVSTADEMIAKAIALLQNPATTYYSVVPYKIEETARKIMKLFGYDSEE